MPERGGRRRDMPCVCPTYGNGLATYKAAQAKAAVAAEAERLRMSEATMNGRNLSLIHI